MVACMATFDLPPAFAGASGDASPSPLERFALQHVDPRRSEVNHWTAPKGHTRLLLGAARANNIRTEEIGPKKDPHFTLSRSGKRIGGIFGPMTTLVSDLAVRATSSREMARRYLALSGVPHLPSRTFHASQGRSAANLLDDLSHPVSIGPSSTQVHGGVATNLTTAEQLSHAWNHAVDACSGLPLPKQLVDVEVSLPWLPLRLFVVSEAVVASVARVPIYIVGDDVQTVGALAAKELERSDSPRMMPPLNDTNDQDIFRVSGVDPESVLDEGKMQFLGHVRGAQTGPKWTVDVTGRLSQDLTTLAVEATWAFPGLGATAVDILTPSMESGRDAVVAAVDPAADLREFRYPALGRPRLPNIAIMKRFADFEKG